MKQFLHKLVSFPTGRSLNSCSNICIIQPDRSFWRSRVLSATHLTAIISQASLTHWCAPDIDFPTSWAPLLFLLCEHPDEPVNGVLLTPAQWSFTCCSHKAPFTPNIHHCRTVPRLGGRRCSSHIYEWVLREARAAASDVICSCCIFTTLFLFSPAFLAVCEIVVLKPADTDNTEKGLRRRAQTPHQLKKKNLEIWKNCLLLTLYIKHIFYFLHNASSQFLQLKIVILATLGTE